MLLGTWRHTLIKLQGRVARKLDTHDSENRLAGLPPRITRITDRPTILRYTHKFPSRPKDVTDGSTLSDGMIRSAGATPAHPVGLRVGPPRQKKRIQVQVVGMMQTWHD